MRVLLMSLVVVAVLLPGSILAGSRLGLSPISILFAVVVSLADVVYGLILACGPGPLMCMRLAIC